MKVYFPRICRAVALAGGMLLGLSGCHHHQAGLFYSPPPPPEPLGTKVDDLMWKQEDNAEASKYVVYQHEFKLNEPPTGQEQLGANQGGANQLGPEQVGIRLNEYGEDHVKRIAQMLRQGTPYPVVVERSQTSSRPGTQHAYPVHFNPQLDLQRREVVVAALKAMGIEDADEQVVVAPALAQPYTDMEAERAYIRGLSSGGSNGGGFGGGGGGGGFGGGGFF